MLSTAVIAVVVSATQYVGDAPAPTVHFGGAVPAAVAEPVWIHGNPNIHDELNRTVAKGFGTATQGGPWDSSLPSVLSVSAGAGRVSPVSPGTTVTSTLRGVSTANELFQATFSLRDLPARGSGETFGVQLRHQTSGDTYSAVVHVLPSGAADIAIRRQVGADITTLAAEAASFTVKAGKPFVVAGYVAAGNGSHVQLRMRAWPVNVAVPDFQLALIDNSASSITSAGRYGVLMTTADNTTGPQTNLWGVDGSTLVLSPVQPSGVPSAAPSTSSSARPAPSGTPSSSTAAPSSSSPRPSTSAPPSSTSAAGSSTNAPPAQPPVPGSGNTGVPAGTQLTVHKGDLVVTKPHTTISGLDIHGFVLIRASFVTIKNSIIRGGTVTHAIGLVDAIFPSYVGTVVQDSTLLPTNPKPGLDGLKGMHITATRLNISRTIDGAKILGDNVKITGSWIHDLTTFAHDPYQNNTPSHSDGVQIEAGHHITLSNNMIEGGYNSGIQITQSVGAVRDVIINGSVLGGGSCTVNVSQMPGTGLNVTIVNNRFTRTSTYGCPMIIDRSVAKTVGRNYFADDVMPFTAVPSAPVPVTPRR